MSASTDFSVEYVAGLARLDLTAEETARYQSQLDGILSYIEALREIDVEGVEPTAHPAPVLDRIREDAAGESLPRESILANAPDQAMDQFRVPKVVDPS